MDVDVNTPNENIRKIEDIIDIQKANGSFSIRQVAFNLPETDSTLSANFAKSLESGLTKTSTDNEYKKTFKKLRFNRRRSPLPDVVSWPSDSDITVLRMKLCITGSDLKDRAGSLIPGDGLHQRDSSSMINLATLIRQSQTPSKHSFNFEEYLLPLTSWEGDRDLEPEVKDPKVAIEENQTLDYASKYNEGDDYNIYEAAVCSHQRHNYGSRDSSSDYSRIGTVSKLARFLRLYFCPCCTCLYKLEKMKDDPSVYFTQRTFNVMKDF